MSSPRSEQHGQPGITRAKYFLVLFSALVLILLFSILSIIGKGLRSIISDVRDNYVLVAEAAALIFLGELIKSQRFVVAARAKGVRLSRATAVEAHFSGLFIGMLTPAFSGAAPTVSSIIGSKEGLDPMGALSIALSAAFMDSAIPALAAIVIIITTSHWNVLVLLISIIVIMLWAVALGSPLAQALNSSISREHVRQAIKVIVDQAATLQSSLKSILSSRRSSGLMVALTVASYLVETMSVVAVLRAWGFPGVVFQGFEALMLSYVGGNFPTPGGEFGVEYSMLTILSGPAVVLWRVAYVIVAMAPAVIIGKVISSYIDYGTFVYNYYKGLLASHRP